MRPLNDLEVNRYNRPKTGDKTRVCNCGTNKLSRVGFAITNNIHTQNGRTSDPRTRGGRGGGTLLGRGDACDTKGAEGRSVKYGRVAS